MKKLRIFGTFLFIVSLVFAIFIFQKRDVIFQEGNPTPLAIAASKMLIKDENVVKVGEKDHLVTYLGKQGESGPFIKMMKKEGWKLTDRSETQNLLVFEKGNHSIGVGYKYYTRYYTVFYRPSNNSLEL